MNEQTNEYVSLFDFLGKPAGTELGGQVFKEAKTQKIRVQSRQVTNPKYTGQVMCYPKQFLETYFNKNSYSVY
jgi:hypothetical protein